MRPRHPIGEGVEALLDRFPPRKTEVMESLYGFMDVLWMFYGCFVDVYGCFVDVYGECLLSKWDLYDLLQGTPWKNNMLLVRRKNP